MPTYVTPEEVAEALKMSVKTVLSLARRAELPMPIKFGHRLLRFDLQDVKAVLNRKHAFARG
jgi:excisionase family DNA binding protein